MLDLDVKEMETLLALEPTGTDQVDLQVALSWYYRRLHPDKAKQLAQAGGQNAMVLGYLLGIAQSDLCLGYQDNLEGDAVGAIYKYQSALNTFDQLGINDDKVKVLVSMALSYNHLGDNQKALAYLLEGLALVKVSGDHYYEVYVLNNIGEIYKTTMQMYDEAIRYFSEALTLCQSLRHVAWGAVLGNMADCYLKSGQPEKGLPYALEGIKRGVELSDLTSQSYGYQILSRIYRQMGRLSDALQASYSGVSSSQLLKDAFIYTEILLELSGVLWESQQFELALIFGELALVRAKTKSGTSLLQRVHQQLAEIHMSMGEFEKAAYHFKDHGIALKASINTELEAKVAAITTDDRIQEARHRAETYQQKNVELKEKTDELAKKAKALELAYRDIDMISEIGQKITSFLEVETIVDTIYNNINMLMDAPILGLGLYDSVNQLIDYRSFIEKNMKAPRFVSEFDIEVSLASRCIATKTVVVENQMAPLNGIGYLPSLLPEDEDLEPLSVIFCPLIVDNQVIGVLTVQSYQENAYNHQQVETLKALSAYIAIAITNAKKSEELSETLLNLQLTQEQLIQQEKMASLGLLISGIAHEINTPLGAIQASINNAMTYIAQVLSNENTQMLHGLDPQQYELTFQLVRATLGKDMSLSSQEERQYKKLLANELKSLNCDHADDFADMLVDMGILSDVGEFQMLFCHPDSPSMMKTVYEISGIGRNVQNMNIAVTRAAKMIYALKSYAHQEQSQEPVLIDLAEGIETVLIIYRNNFKHGVELIKHFEDIPQVMCHPDALNQVWTNLIHNALQAMNYTGTLEIRVFLENQIPWDAAVVVQVIDNGSGISETIKDRIFSPFFTTKKAGEGSGIGLGICKKIVESHKGTLTFESQPGRTAFTVRLPIA